MSKYKKELYVSKQQPPSKVAEYLAEIRYAGFDIHPYVEQAVGYYKIVMSKSKMPIIPTKFYEFDEALGEALQLIGHPLPAPYALRTRNPKLEEYLNVA